MGLHTSEGAQCSLLHQWSIPKNKKYTTYLKRVMLKNMPCVVSENSLTKKMSRCHKSVRPVMPCNPLSDPSLASVVPELSLLLHWHCCCCNAGVVTHFVALALLTLLQQCHCCCTDFFAFVALALSPLLRWHHCHCYAGAIALNALASLLSLPWHCLLHHVCLTSCSGYNYCNWWELLEGFKATNHAKGDTHGGSDQNMLAWDLRLIQQQLR